MLSIVEMLKYLQMTERNFGDLEFNDVTAEAANDFIAILENQIDEIEE